MGELLIRTGHISVYPWGFSAMLKVKTQDWAKSLSWRTEERKPSLLLSHLSFLLLLSQHFSHSQSSLQLHTVSHSKCSLSDHFSSHIPLFSLTVVFETVACYNLLTSFYFLWEMHLEGRCKGEIISFKKCVCACVCVCIPNSSVIWYLSLWYWKGWTHTLIL